MSVVGAVSWLLTDLGGAGSGAGLLIRIGRRKDQIACLRLRTLSEKRGNLEKLSIQAE
jgi:hypothetical protein